MKRIFTLCFFLSLLCFNQVLFSQACPGVVLTPGTQQCGDTADGGDTDGDDNPCLGSYDGGDDYFFQITIPAANDGQSLQLDLTSTGSWTGIAISDACGGGNCFGAATSSSGNESFLSDPLVGGTTYYIHISTWPTPQSATFCLDAAFASPPMPPANDDCGSAEAIACGAAAVMGTTTAGTDNDPATCGGAGDGNGPGVWYSFVGTGGTVIVTLNADPGTGDDLGDSQLAVYSGSCAALVCEDGNDDATPPGGSGSQVTFTSMVGTTYYFYVDGFGTNEGNFEISVDCPTCVDPADVSVSNVTSTSADISWTSDPAVVSSSVWVCPAGDPAPTTGAIGTCLLFDSAATNPYTASGLMACSDYDVYVEDDCGMGPTAIVGPENFSTPGMAAPLMPACGTSVCHNPCAGAGIGSYGGNDDITWVMCADPGMIPIITFTYVDIESNTTCSWDFLTITGVDTYGPMCGEPDGDGGVGSGLACGQCFYSPEVGGCITVQFQSDGSVNETGFCFDFTCVTALPTDCPSPAACPGSMAVPSILPISLENFDARAENDYNMVTWATASEVNNEWQVIETSLDGESWTELGRVQGAGNSVEMTNYSMRDNAPSALTYYRLKSVDFDGYTIIFHAVTVRREVEEKTQIVALSPNPATEQFTLNINALNAQDVNVVIVNIEGRVIQNQSYSLAKGMNERIVDISSYTSGVYFIRMLDGKSNSTKKLIVQ